MADLEYNGEAESSWGNEHEAFAASRSLDFVYVPSDDTYFRKLDAHAETVENDAKLPLVVLGDPGSGKSALLANWVKDRRRQRHKDEFLFQHFVGCSIKSKQLGQMLHRLESALKEHFQLREMEVPGNESGVIWALNRYLAAAAKKHSPARITIVIDGIDALKGSEIPEGALHWLPTALPAGVRFIVTTVKTQPGTTSHHRTYAELLRRKCPIIEMEPLGLDVRDSIIGSFSSSIGNALPLDDEQRHRLASTELSSQPLFLRTVLYALHLAVKMATMPFGDFLDICLSQESSEGLISMIMDLCCAYVDDTSDNTGSDSMFGKILAIIYVSRYGMSDEEIWGAAALFLNQELTDEQKNKVLSIIRDMTMLVDGLRTFSHEAFKRVVYDKFICTPGQHVAMHQRMALYFSRLEPCARKIDCLSYHFEVAGSWTKLKNTLTDIEMFNVWWTPEHKMEFVQLWSSLMCLNPEKKMKHKIVTGEFEENMVHDQTVRPFFDPVEEFVKSVNEYRDKTHPGDEILSKVILDIGDFLLEAAILGHETDADVPSFIHPMVTNEDMASLGVAHLSMDEEGRSILVAPVIAGEGGDAKPQADMVPAKSNDDVPMCTTYFYRRWMWIQFPIVALSNCGERYIRGIEAKESESFARGGMSQNGASRTGMFSKNAELTKPRPRRDSLTNGNSLIEEVTAIPVDSSNEKNEKRQRRRDKLMKLRIPHIPRRKKVVIPGKEEDPNDLYGHWERETGEIRDEIEELKHELDILIGHRRRQLGVIAKIDDELTDATKMANQTVTNVDRLRILSGKAARVKKDHRKARILEHNLKSVLLMCERHPAHSPALVEELELKLHQDEMLCKEIRQKLRDETYERVTYEIDYTTMKNYTREAKGSLSKMLERREEQLANLTKATEFEATRTRRSKTGSRKGRPSKSILAKSLDADDNGVPDDEEDWYLQWETKHQTIAAMTGITDPEVFFEKFNNTEVLEQQMTALKTSSESRVNELKHQHQEVEDELEQLRYNANSTGISNRDTRDKQTALNNSLSDLKRIDERSFQAQRLVQLACAGLGHIAEELGVVLDGDAPVVEIIHQIEMVLDSLMEEKDKAAQKNVNDMPLGRSALRSDSSLEGPSTRAPELEAALQRYTSPKARLPSRLPSKAAPAKTQFQGGRPPVSMLPSAFDFEEEEEEFEVPTRKLVKTVSHRNVRLEARRAARRSQVVPAT
uniref:NACHT domain-containing protein n=1 Tax=Phaeomonas parva TaxID=124430 RepID=A0A7S1U833_9STRA|mmetsp:Transcript_3588/g.10297  ORF Transcript_3588/g.10297 Transcript_3588/m.10297 type:complete len:1210 (+) Transcript_3588:245-3874(+)